jgi:hypothetical protein
MFIAVLAILVEAFLAFQQSERLLPPGPESSSIDYWKMFAGISKERKYIEEVSAYYRIPVFTPDLQAHVGKELTIKGFYLPYSKIDSVIIISRYPNASCFYCGQAGIESVVMVELGREVPKTFRMDELFLVKGKLLLNNSDINRLAFILTDATVEKL